MRSTANPISRRVIALMTAVITILTLFPGTALAAQDPAYHDPAAHWITASNRTNELDSNAIVTRETFFCCVCEKATIFTVFRTPEYTRDGKTALSRNVLYSDGTLVSGEGIGSILDGVPGVDATYTGYHWSKAVCETCGTLNTNMGIYDYCYTKNIYRLNDCAAEFTETLPETVSYAYADDTYHTKTVDGGTYCSFCFGSHHNHTSTLERHDLVTDIIPQLDNQRFAVVRHCSVCDYSSYEFVAAKSVVADYYGVVDGQAHTLTVSDLSEAGVSTSIRYGNSAESCTMTAPSTYTEEGQYTVYYAVTYTYQGVSMTENGVAYVWLRDETPPAPAACSCGCGGASCGCATQSCDRNNCCSSGNCGHGEGDHNYVYLDSVKPTCTTLGYDRYLCSICGSMEKRNYVNATGHTYQAVVVRDADCEHEGKTMEVCKGCGEVKVTMTPKGVHRYKTYSVKATCANPGYTVRECSVCGDRTITDIVPALAHSYKTVVTPATCTGGGMTVHTCEGCGSSFVTDYTDPRGHKWDSGKVTAQPSCTGEGVREFTCLTCGAKRSETISATGHSHGDPATCADPELCTVCGAVLDKAHGHSFQPTVTPATCLKLGYTTFVCADCGETYKSDYTDALGHDYVAVVTGPTCTERGYTTHTCSRCGDSYVTDYTDALGHEWNEGATLVHTSCNSEGMIDHRCVRCDYHYLEAVSTTGHTPGKAATCTEPQLCQTCGAVLQNAHGHDYKAVVTAPTCTKMGYTTFTCASCGDSYQGNYTNPTGHKESGWIVGKEPTTYAEGLRYQKCLICGETLTSETLEKLYNLATTDTHGEAVLGDYLVIVTDTGTRNPVSNATVTLNSDTSFSVRLPNSRILDYGDPTTVTVLWKSNKAPIRGVAVNVTDKNDNFGTGTTETSGALILPSSQGMTGEDGTATFGGRDANRDPFTFTIRVVNGRNGRPIQDATVTVGKTGTITVQLPDGIDLTEKYPVVFTLTDNRKIPQPDVEIIAKGDRDKETGKTHEDGTLTLPEVEITERHGAYIVGLPGGIFGPERNMTRSEVAAIFARLLAEKKGDTILPVPITKFEDVPANAWYSGYVRYLTNYGVTFGTGEGYFSPNREITRGEYVAMAVRFFNVYGDGNAEIMKEYAGFTDVAPGYWAAEYIKDAAIHGWVLGYGNGTFGPDRLISRAEAVVITNRLLGRVADRDYVDGNLRKLNTFSDMTKGHWAYYDVMESANTHTTYLNGGESWRR